MSFNPNSANDWTPVTITKTAKQKTAGMSSAAAISSMRMTGAVVTEKKVTAGLNKSAHTGASTSMRKLEDSSEEFKHEKVDAELSKAISQARQLKKMTQKELATAINERPQIIQQYESGAAIPNPQILVKLDRALGVHLPRGKK
jgi:putative transcription factor